METMINIGDLSEERGECLTHNQNEGTEVSSELGHSIMAD